MSKITTYILFLLCLTCVSINASEPIPVALLTNTTVELDELQKVMPSPFEFKQLKSKVATRENTEYYHLENQTKVDFEIIQKYRFDLIPKILNAIKVDLKTELLFVLQNENRQIVREDGSQDIIVKLKLISVDLKEYNVIDFIEEAKLINVKDPAKIESSIANASKEIAPILLKKVKDDFLKKINRRLGRSDPYLPMMVLTFFDMEKSEFEENKKALQQIIKDSLKAKDDSFADQYVDKEKIAQIRFNSIYEANDIVLILRKAFVETNSSILNSYFIQYSTRRLEPVFKRSQSKRIIVNSKDAKKCKVTSENLILLLKKDNIEVDVFWVDDPKLETIYKAGKNFLSPDEFSTYGNILVKNGTIENLNQWLSGLNSNVEGVKYTVRFKNEICIFLDLE